MRQRRRRRGGFPSCVHLRWPPSCRLSLHLLELEKTNPHRPRTLYPHQ
uniref:Uncharacterized protein n=1 Tax=Arundo donax TaxID=35708 RepID=A0A0A8ZST7_ARUDO